MRVLLDTNVLLRRVEPSHPHHRPALDALAALAAAGHTFSVASQSCYEFLVAATRPADVRGLAMSPAQAVAELRKITGRLEVLHDSSAVAAELFSIVADREVRGKNVHDARLVATVRVYGLDALLTLNSRDFSAERYPDDLILDPSREPADALLGRLRSRLAR